MMPACNSSGTTAGCSLPARYKVRFVAQRVIDEWIEFYNEVRPPPPVTATCS